MTSIRFVGDLSLWAGVLTALLVSLVAWRYYRRESYELPGRLRWLLPLLRAASLFLVVLILTGPVLHHRQVVGRLGRVMVFLDASQSMGVMDGHMPTARKLLIAQQQGWLPEGQADVAEINGSQVAASSGQSVASGLALFDQMSRWRRVENSLLDPSLGLLTQLTRTHDVELIALSDSSAASLWDQHAAGGPADEVDMEPLGITTDLSSGIADKLNLRRSGDNAALPRAEADAGSAVVLLTDGLHNSGPSPLQTARALRGRKVPMYTIGFGSKEAPPDLAVLEVEHPDMVFQKDQVRGAIIIKDQMPAGESFVVQISHEGEILWQEQLTSHNAPVRRVEFQFSIDALVERLHAQLDAQVRRHSLPLCLQASITPLDGETETSNNDMAMRFAVITQSYRLLLIDGRSRWETRYLRNVFQRDDQWHVDAILVGPSTDRTELPRGDGANMFPTNEAALFDYDWIVFGEVPTGVLADHELVWIRDFVERRGGGIVFLDGERGRLRQLDNETLGPLLPVSWLPVSVDSLPTRLQLTESGAGQDAMMLASTTAENAEFWRELPAPHRIVPVEATPGAEVFAEAVVGGEARPVIVARSFGAGRVLYFAFDETWRWRYKAADAYHQRFWNQVAQWIMQRPFAVSDEYVSLDSGPPSCARGESAAIRVRLRGLDGRPADNATVDALLWREGRIVSTVSLSADGSGHGVYRGRTGPLPEGNYEVSVRAAGFSNEALKARTTFVVLPPPSRELQQVACDDGLLREMALASGGQFLWEEQIGQLVELLKPLSSGHVLESDTVLWQSYWWFAAIVSLLAMEWMLRKRAGLL